eukprot:tig00000449_g945.t1
MRRADHFQRGKVDLRYHSSMAASAGDAIIVSTRDPVRMGSPGARADPWMIRQWARGSLAVYRRYGEEHVRWQLEFDRHEAARSREEEAASSSGPLVVRQCRLLESYHI